MGYPSERKEAILRKMLPPNNKSVRELAQEEGISEATLYNWTKAARAEGQRLPDGDTTPAGWCSTEKFAAVVEWLAVDGLLEHFAEKRSLARRRYRRFVSEGIGQGSVWNGLSQQIYLGDERFVERMQGRAGSGSDDVNIPKVQRRRPPPSLAQIESAHESRAEAVVAAYQTGGYSYQQITTHFGVHFTTVGRYVRTASHVKAHRGQKAQGKG